MNNLIDHNLSILEGYISRIAVPWKRKIEIIIPIDTVLKILIDGQMCICTYVCEVCDKLTDIII